MSDWPVGLSTGCFYRTSIFDCLERIHAAGFSTIEICSFPAHLDYHDLATVRRAGERIRELQLEPYSFHAPFADQIDITSPDEHLRNSSAQEMFRAAEAAAEIQVRYFVIHPGPEKGGFPEGERLQRMANAASALNHVARRCRELGIRLVLENMLPHLFFGHARDVLWILGALETTDVGICLDTGHAHLSGDLRTVAHKLSGHLWMVHASDNRGQRDDHLPPGDGDIAWAPFIDQLTELQFKGAFILEIAGDRDADDVLSGARRARLFLREITRQRDLAHRPGAPPTA
jgi:sugar phosphate isomerase/epimerase